MTLDEVLIRRAEVVRIHLDALDDIIRIPNPSISAAVRASLSLRFLFDGALNQVAHTLRLQIQVPAPTLDSIPFDQAILFVCGGYRFGEAIFSPHYTYREPGLQSSHRQQFERQMAASPSTHAMMEMKLGQFMKQPCLALCGEAVTREATVRYVANKCGGAHHHDDTAQFEAIDRRLTTVGHVLRVNGDGQSAVFLETLGTAWFLLRSPSVVTLRAALSG